MSRKAWVPDPSVDSVLTFTGKLVSLLAVALSGIFLVGKGTMEMIQLRSEWREFNEVRFPAYQEEVVCLIMMVARDSVPQYDDCKPKPQGETNE